MNDPTLPSYQLGRARLAAGALFLLASLSVSAIAAPSSDGPVIAGTARVIDGDTIDVSGQRIRLEGIDAPETAQTCKSADGADWSCGKAAAAALKSLIGTQSVSCSATGKDKYDRTLAQCSAAGVNINRSMVESGYAWAFVKYSSAFVDAEATARAAKAGVWRGPAVAPWDYRAGSWQTAETSAPAGCAIKGNISDNGRIYHLPWSPWYAKVKIDEADGERWFCNEAEAAAAGWRPAMSN